MPHIYRLEGGKECDPNTPVPERIKWMQFYQQASSMFLDLTHVEGLDPEDYVRRRGKTNRYASEREQYQYMLSRSGLEKYAGQIKSKIDILKSDHVKYPLFKLSGMDDFVKRALAFHTELENNTFRELKRLELRFMDLKSAIDLS